MTKIAAIRAANRDFEARCEKGLVGVFIGGTAGLGEATMKAFARHTVEPRIYFVGRNEDAAKRITEELKTINEGAAATFLKADVSELKNVDAVVEYLKEAEEKINFLVLTTGYLSLNGRNETPEGLDHRMAVTYYSRLRFITALLPLLHAGARTPATIGARVLSIYAAGTEGMINASDLELKSPSHFSAHAVATQTVTFTSFALEKLSVLNPDIAFYHGWPDIVLTGILRDLPWWVRMLRPLTALVAVDAEDSGEGFFHLAVGEEGRTGFGILDWRGESRDTRTGKVGWLGTKGWYSEEKRELVWKHTLEVFERVRGKAERK